MEDKYARIALENALMTIGLLILIACVILSPIYIGDYIGRLFGIEFGGVLAGSVALALLVISSRLLDKK